MAEYNLDFCKAINDGKNIQFAPMELSPGAGTPTEQEYNEAGWYKNKIGNATNVPEYKIAVLSKYAYDPSVNGIVAVYDFIDQPAPVRVFSKLRLYGALVSASLWEPLETWLKSQTIDGVNAYTAFMLAQELNDSNPLFNEAVQNVKAALHVDDNIVEAILKAAQIN